MKNSKILSLLTAAALVVSSFSGLAMNGGVALAAQPGAVVGKATDDTNINNNIIIGDTTKKGLLTANKPAGHPSTADGDYVIGTTVIGGTSTNNTGKIRVAINAADSAGWDNQMTEPAFETLFPTRTITPNATEDIAKYSITFANAGVKFYTAAGVETTQTGMGAGYRVLEWTYTMATTDTTAGAQVDWQYTSVGGGALGAAVSLNFRETVVNDKVYPSAVTEVAFVNGASKKMSDTWKVNGRNGYVTWLGLGDARYEIGAVVGGSVRRFTSKNAGEAGDLAAAWTTTAAPTVAGSIVTDYTAMKNSGDPGVWYVTTSSSDENIIRVTPHTSGDIAATAAVIEDERYIDATAYGLGTATIYVRLENNLGTILQDSMTVTVEPDDTIIRLWNEYNRDTYYVDLQGDEATTTLTADTRAGSYASTTDVSWVLVSHKVTADDEINKDSDKIAARYVKMESDSTSVKLTAVGNATCYLYVYSNKYSLYDKYLADAKKVVKDTNPLGQQIKALERMIRDGETTVRKVPIQTFEVTEKVGTDVADSLKLRTDGVKGTITPYVNQQGVEVNKATASLTKAKVTAESDATDVATVVVNDNGTITVTPVAAGTANVKISAEYNVGGLKKTPETTVVVDVISKDEPTPEPEHKAGEPVAEDGVVGYLNDDLKTVTVTDATVVSKAITIPATIQDFEVVAIDPQAFKGTNAKTVYVVGSVDTIGKGAFKNSKVKKVYFSDPAALQTVGKNAFKKTNAKVVGIDGSFSEEAAKALKSAGAKTVKNNGTVK